MGYYDERFGSDVAFVLKFFLLLCVIRAIAYFIGYTAYVPVIDDVSRFMLDIVSSCIETLEHWIGWRLRP